MKQRQTAFVGAVLLLVGACSKPAQKPQEGVHQPTSVRPVSWDNLITFKDPESCWFNPVFQRLMDSLITITPDERLIPGTPLVPEAQAGAIGRLRWTLVDNPGGLPLREAYLPVAGEWHGIPVAAVQRQMVPTSDVDGISIFFRAAPEVVRSKLNEIGLKIPKGGFRETEDEVSTTIGIQSKNGLTEFYCNT